MSLVSTRASLKHLCSIERDQASTDDSWGTPAPPDWQPHLTEQPCRAWTTLGREAVDAETFAAVEDIRLIVPVDTDVTTGDRVASVIYRGVTVFAGPISIRSVLYKHDHLELALERIA